jgi:hypothetical protein
MKSDPITTVTTAKGASFTQVSNVGGIAGSRFYYYRPSEQYSPGQNLTPFIYVYGNKPYNDGSTAWNALTGAGLDTIAEAEHAFIIMVNPVGLNWGKIDIDVYEAVMKYFSFIEGEVPITFYNLQYAIGEGSGATFINNHLTQNAKRLAAVLTFGGEIDTPYPLYALPAYIVSGSQKAIDYYLTTTIGTVRLPNSGRDDELIEYFESLWAAEEAGQKTIHYNTARPVEKVIVNGAGATSLDKALIADCWNSLFRYTSRECLTANTWMWTKNLYNNAEFTLVARPNYEKGNMLVNKVDGIGNGIYEDKESSYWYEFIPKAVQDAMVRGSGEKFPLYVLFHGGAEHGLFDTEFLGLADAAMKENFIIVAPNGTGAEQHLQLIDHMIKKYNADPTRVYCSGFSGGVGNVLTLAAMYPERFAAVMAMSRWSGPFFTDLVKSLPNYNYDLDLPIGFVGNGKETESTNYDNKYVWYDALLLAFEVNEIEAHDGELDFSKYYFWGFPVDNETFNNTATGYPIWKAVKYDENDIPMIYLMHAEAITHNMYVEYGQHIWDWFKQFSRDPKTMKIIYTSAE